MAGTVEDVAAGTDRGKVLESYVARLAALGGIDDPVEAAREAAALSVDLVGVLARFRQAAVYEATRSESYAAVGARLEVGRDAVNRLVTRHLARTTSEVRDPT